MKLVWVGLAFMLAVLALGTATLVIGDIRIKSEKDVYFFVRVPEVLGIKENDEVRVDGLPLGKVVDVQLSEGVAAGQKGGVYLRCRIDHAIDLYDGWTITVEGFALIGGAYVAVRRGTPPHVKDRVDKNQHDSIPSALDGLVDLGPMKAISKLIYDHDKDINEILANIREVTVNIRDITKDFKEGRGTIPQTVEKAGKDLELALTGLRADLQDVLKNGNRLIDNTNNTVTNINTAVDQIKESLKAINDGKGTVGKLIQSPELYETLTKTAKDLQDVILQIKNSKGIFGAVVNDEKLKNDVASTISEVRSASESLNKVIKAIEQGWIPKFVQDQEVPEKIKAGLEGLDKTLGRAGRAVAYLHAGSSRFHDSKSTISHVDVVFWPSDDKYLLFGGALYGVDRDSGAIMTKDNVNFRDDFSKFTFEAQLAYRLPIAKPLTIRAGMFEGKIGGAVDFEWSDWGAFHHPVKLTMEARDTYKSVRQEDIDEDIYGPMYRVSLKTPVFTRGAGWFGDVLASLKLVVGGSRLFQDHHGHGSEYFIGLSLEYEEEDIRTILGLVSASK